MARYGRGASELLRIATALLHFTTLATPKAQPSRWFELEIMFLVATPTKIGIEVSTFSSPNASSEFQIKV